MKKLFTIFAMLFAVVALNAQQARIVLEAGDVWGDGTGYQILMDAQANTTENITGNFACGSSYSEYEYMLPSNADASDSYVCISATMEMLIPAGTYDYVVLNPGCTSFGVVYIASDNCDQSKGDGVSFEANKTYHFVATLDENTGNDCITINIHDGLTAIEEVNTTTFAVYPNPANDFLNVKAENVRNIEIINLIGQTINTSVETTVNISNLNSGVYFVRVNFVNGETAIQKFIKK